MDSRERYTLESRRSVSISVSKFETGLSAKNFNRNILELTFLCKPFCFRLPFPWCGSPQGSDIRSCLKCPMLRTCCFPTPTPLYTCSHTAACRPPRRPERGADMITVCGEGMCPHSAVTHREDPQWDQKGYVDIQPETHWDPSDMLGSSHLCTPSQSDRHDVEISMRLAGSHALG